mmetsp:Transcript_14565/g.44138  ORF Transcript_14565/g.44138 Transcript_14565/m.44138 type:complete len:98 (+) Transcript_14565:2173-2466(+)
MLADLRAWLCPHNARLAGRRIELWPRPLHNAQARLAGLLLANGLVPSASDRAARRTDDWMRARSSRRSGTLNTRAAGDHRPAAAANSRQCGGAARQR